MLPIRVHLRAADPLTLAGLRTELSDRTDPLLHQVSDPAEAEVLVVVTEAVTCRTLAALRKWAKAGSARAILVTGETPVLGLHNFTACRIHAVLTRRAASGERLAHVIQLVQHGEAVLPPELQGSLLTQLASLEREVMEPHRLSTSGLHAREVEILRLISEGLSTAQIAEKLAYSERTVKNGVHMMLNRLGLRNRAQAVAHAVRDGLI